MTTHRATEVYQPRSTRAKIAEAAESARAWLRSLVAETARRLVGMGLVLFALALIGALISFDPSDPSFDVATGHATNNMLGAAGAYASDILYRALGDSAFAPPLAITMWGLQLTGGQHIERIAWRSVALVFAVILQAAGLAALPWDSVLPAGLGGIVGMLANVLTTKLTEAVAAPWLGLVIAAILSLAAWAFGFVAAGIRLKTVWSGLNGTADLALGASTLMGRSVLRRRAHDHEDEDETWEQELEGDEAEQEVEGEDLETREPESDFDAIPEPLLPREPIEKRVRRTDDRRKKVKLKTQLQPALNLTDGEYQLPSLGLLTEPPAEAGMPAFSDDALEENARLLEAVLGDFGVRGRIVAVRPGPVVTLYELEPAAGVKSSRVISLSDDIARSMSAVATRVAVIPGRNVIGVELPNGKRETVYLRELFAAPEYEKSRAPLTLALGKTIGGEPVMADLAKMPHLLIAGTTGSGKSVALNTMILSLLYRMPPEHCRIIMIDPKMLELSVYDGIPHLLSPVVIDPKKAVVALKWAVREMESRYGKMAKIGVRGVEAFNERVKKAREKGEELKRTVQTGFDRETGRPVYEDEVLDLQAMPYIVVVVDEMADLMMISGKEIEGAVQRLAQMARAAGIHLIAATQRPSVDVITGTIKANFPTRISFQVTSKIDSRTILGEQGAEQLLGQGDMLYMMAGGRIRRVHGPYVSDSEVEDVVRFLKTQGHPDYLDAVTEEPDEDQDDPYGLYGSGGEGGDDLFDKAVAIVARERKVSTSYIQRRLQIGYNRAARLIERMEEDGMISGPNHQGKREVLLPEGRE
jgi:S-DNA-T family DNA segregation ATPase FtsK/SpoIIIE